MAGERRVQSGTGEALDVDPEATQLLLKALAMQTERASGGRDVSPMLTQGCTKDLSLEALEVALFRRTVVLALLPGDLQLFPGRLLCWADLSREITGLDHASA